MWWRAEIALGAPSDAPPHAWFGMAAYDSICPFLFGIFCVNPYSSKLGSSSRESPQTNQPPYIVYTSSVCIVRIRYIFLSFSFALWIHVRPGLHVTWTHGPGRPRADENHMFICQSLDGQFWRKIKFSKFCTKVRWPEALHTRAKNTYVLMY
jgi:hypothetical protein